MGFRIVDLAQIDAHGRAEAARILREALVHMPSAYNGPNEAEAEVERMMIEDDRLGFAAFEGDALVGWIGAIRTYDHGWELHPLVVDPPRQRRGIGTLLVATLEAVARTEGALTLYLGTDDDYGGTNLFGRDLFPGVLEKAMGLEAVADHAFGFYRRLGYEVVGVMPDVNGPGRPDILMAKRIAPSSLT
jgi:aminoglycoside 6'-N-acetyltransferase I